MDRDTAFIEESVSTMVKIMSDPTPQNTVPATENCQDNAGTAPGQRNKMCWIIQHLEENGGPRALFCPGCPGSVPAVSVPRDSCKLMSGSILLVICPGVLAVWNLFNVRKGNLCAR